MYVAGSISPLGPLFFRFRRTKAKPRKLNVHKRFHKTSRSLCKSSNLKWKTSLLIIILSFSSAQESKPLNTRFNNSMVLFVSCYKVGCKVDVLITKTSSEETA